jgi:hypothetical protein
VRLALNLMMHSWFCCRLYNYSDDEAQYNALMLFVFLTLSYLGLLFVDLQIKNGFNFIVDCGIGRSCDVVGVEWRCISGSHIDTWDIYQWCDHCDMTLQSM